ncbi:restriction endonuclease [Hymenobacter jeollabukensis]|uniref:Restriction endonuclease n=1 Tax=Hymenobacter jeollabukensis TaxID=2025313 RepID=A0A5R8WVJ0_9BACT|nr:restriction endonuclease [Hymenobacter jeollabukensis]TLM96518.1 restriction endonuclease [Hymenobacter jeollabukensis]
MDWKKYEEEVFDALSAHYINDTIIKNHKIKGRYSNRSRQIDIYIEQKINGSNYITIVDSKNYNKKIDVKTVESFISMIDDVGADYGIMISELGFTKSAFNRAFNNPKGIELDIYNFDEITNLLQGEGAVPYSGSNGALILAPFSWIVDATRRPGALCFLYRRGMTLEDAISSREFAYINFWLTTDEPKTIEELYVQQSEYIANSATIESNELIASENAVGFESKIRITKAKEYSTLEMAGYIDFEGFIFFCILHTDKKYKRRNLRKLHLLLRNTLPVWIRETEQSEEAGSESESLPEA